MEIIYIPVIIGVIYFIYFTTKTLFKGPNVPFKTQN